MSHIYFMRGAFGYYKDGISNISIEKCWLKDGLSFLHVPFSGDIRSFSGGKFSRAKTKDNKEISKFSHRGSKQRFQTKDKLCKKKNTLTYQILDVPKKDLNDLFEFRFFMFFHLKVFWQIPWTSLNAHHNQK